MVPESFATLYAFLGLVAPGLVYRMVRERRAPSGVESAFREASVVVFASLIFSALSVFLLALMSLVVPTAFVDLQAWVDRGGDYVGAHLWLAATSALIEVGLACVLAYIAGRHLNFDGDEEAPIVRTSVWFRRFQAGVPKGQVAWTSVELTDGTRLWGYMDYFTVGQDLDNRELSLKGPNLTSERPNGSKVKDNYWTYYVVNGSDVRLLKIRYEPEA
jgi:hypothetical protein